MQKKRGSKSSGPYEAYIIHVEHEHDFYFIPEGICIVGEEYRYLVYSLDSLHNFLRAGLLKFPLSELLSDGVTFRNAQIKLEDLQSYRITHGLEEVSVEELLSFLYVAEPTKYHFLERSLHKNV